MVLVLAMQFSGSSLTFGLRQAVARACWRCGIDRESVRAQCAGINGCRGYRGTRKPRVTHQPIRVYKSRTRNRQGCLD